VTDQGLDKFTLSVGESVLDLEKLILDFSQYDQSFWRMKLNKIFRCEQITNEGVKKVGANISKSLKNLKSLSIIFAQFGKLFPSES